MEINEICDPRGWNDFLLLRPTQTGIFLQSWDWGEFQARLGRKVHHFVHSSQSSVHSFAQVIEMPLPFGKKYWYIPRGPVVDEKIVNSKQKIEDLLRDITISGAKNGVWFIRLEPTQPLEPKTYHLKPTIPVQPKQTLILDLTQNREVLLNEMHEKTRYNIRLADRKGVKIKTGQFEEFWKLLKKTSRRDRFSTHPRSYYKKMLTILGREGVMRVRLHVAYFENKPVAAAIIGYFGDTATYLHGASSYEHRALMGPYALHWHIMQDAKKSGYRVYDFWGIDEKRWPGVTRFKLGFGGKVVDYPGAFDLPLSKFWYKIYRLGRKIF